MQAEAVTVTALGGRKQNRALGYATSTVKGDELARTNTVSPANALQGKVAGVTIASGGSGGITTAPKVTIRGNKSLTKNNSPIYVIDGIIMEYEQGAMGGANGMVNGDATMYGNQLKNLNADDYESVTVLKGAAATSLYGARGANGAIVITTKSGKARKGIGVEVNYSHEWGNVYQNVYPLQNLYGTGNPLYGYETDASYEDVGGYVGNSWGPSFASMKGQEIRQYYKYYSPDGIDNPEEAFQAYPDNWKFAYQNSNYDNVSVALTGGSEKATFRLSYGYMNGDGNQKKNNFDRHSINFTANGKINDVFSTNLSLQYSNSNTTNARSINGGDWVRTGLPSIYGYNRNSDMNWYVNHYINPETYATYGQKSGGIASYVNGWITSQFQANTVRNEQTIIAQLGLNAQLTDWLDANVSVSYNKWDVFTETKNSGFVNYANGQYRIDGSHSGSYDGIAQIHGNHRFLDDNLELDVRILGEVYGNTRSTSYYKSTNGGLIVPGVYQFANSFNAITMNEGNVGYTPRNNMTLGVAGVINLSWKDQIYLEVTGRNDWLSTLMYPVSIPYGANNYSVFYPSVNASWVFSDTFDIDPKILSFGKLRASWAQVGKGTDPYATAGGAGGYTVGSIYGPTNNRVRTASPNFSILPNYDLKPELQTSIEFGADLRFLNGMIGVDVAYYKTNTKNQILELNAVKESGVTKQLINAGNIQNQGWEIQLDVTPIRTRTVNWTIGANWSRNRGKIKELGNGNKTLALGTGGGWNVANVPGVIAFEGGAFGAVVAGGGFGTNSQAAARFNNLENPNDPRNGKKMVYVLGSLDNETFGSANATQYGHADAPTNLYYRTVNASNVPGYFGSEASYWGGKEHLTEILGRVEPDFIYGINTNVQVNLPNNSGSLDFYAQIDGHSGGSMVYSLAYYAYQGGALKSTLYGRDKEHGGQARVNYKGEVVYNGLIPDVVFSNAAGNNTTVTSMKTGEKVDLNGMTFREAVDEGHIQPAWTPMWTLYNCMDAGRGVSSQTYMALRELTLGYNFPEKWIKHVGLQSARLSFSARNVCYIINKTAWKGNPDSFVSNNALSPYDMGSTPFVRNFSVSLNLRF